MTERHPLFDDVDLDTLRRRRTVKWTLHGPDVLAAWVAEMDFDVAPPILAALHDAVDRQDFGYTEADLSELTEACADFLLTTHGWDVSPNRIFPVADVLSGISAALDAHLPDGCPVVLPTPGYSPFFEVIELTGRTVVEVPMATAAWGPTLDLERIEGALAAGAGGVLLCNPHNPTGRHHEQDELEALADVVDRHGARVIADELHAPLLYVGPVHQPYAAVSDAAAAHTITVTSASKAWNLPGLRCAQVITSNHDDATRWRELPVFAVADPTPLGVAASVAAYREGGPWLHELITYLDGNRRLLGDLLAEELPGVGYRPPDATYLAWLDCAALGHDDPAGFFLREARVAVSDGPQFGRGFDTFVRLNFATSRTLLERIVRAMGAAHRAAT